MNQKFGNRWRCAVPDCHQDFPTKFSLFHHEESHKPVSERVVVDRRLQCKYPGCDRKFLRRVSLLMHEQSHRPAEERVIDMKFKCSVTGCAKAYPWRHSLKRHMERTHNIDI